MLSRVCRVSAPLRAHARAFAAPAVASPAAIEAAAAMNAPLMETDPELFEAQKKAVARAMQLWDQGKSVERCGKAITWQMTVKYGRSAEEAAELREQVEAALTAASTSSTPTAA